MEADWEVEIGGGAHVIDALWPGFVDLCGNPERVVEVRETVPFPALGDALVRINATGSPVWTSKCDVWNVDEFDPDELDAPAESALGAKACYVDLLPRNDGQWPAVAEATEWCRKLCLRIREVPLRCARADLIVREAVVSVEKMGLGVTAYVTACGSDLEDAAWRLGSALAALADSIAPKAPPAAGASKLQ
ncbi:MAG: hypothetical protein WCA11_19305 [Terracidiphilus sp.]